MPESKPFVFSQQESNVSTKPVFAIDFGVIQAETCAKQTVI